MGMKIERDRESNNQIGSWGSHFCCRFGSRGVCEGGYFGGTFSITSKGGKQSSHCFVAEGMPMCTVGLVLKGYCARTYVSRAPSPSSAKTDMATMRASLSVPSNKHSSTGFGSALFRLNALHPPLRNDAHCTPQGTLTILDTTYNHHALPEQE